jgi:hypothetical protein
MTAIARCCLTSDNQEEDVMKQIHSLEKTEKPVHHGYFRPMHFVLQSYTFAEYNLDIRLAIRDRSIAQN